MKTACRLDLLVMEKFECSRSYAKEAIDSGRVSVNGKPVDKPGKLVTEEVSIALAESTEPRYVSRGGYKLKKALDFFNIDVANKICLDVGASTGGFTHCLLEAGAKKVYAVDSGSGQLSPVLRGDPRVVSMEKTNIRSIEVSSLQGVKIAAADVSFISLTKILEPVKELLLSPGELVCLIKPQFEAGRQALNKKGVVKDVRIHEKVIMDIVGFTKKIELIPLGLTVSPIRGPEGNVEYLLYAKKDTGHTTECSAINFEKLVKSVIKSGGVK